MKICPSFDQKLMHFNPRRSVELEAVQESFSRMIRRESVAFLLLIISDLSSVLSIQTEVELTNFARF